MGFNAIQPMSFRLMPDRPLLVRYHALAFPQQWKQLVRQLQAQKSERPLDKVQVPIYDLNMLVRALVPDVLFIAKGAAGAHTNPWLYSSVAIDPRALLPLVHAWLRTTYQNLPQDDVDWAAAQMLAEDLVWQEHEVDVARWTTNDQGSATPQAGDTFLLLPHVIASQLSRPEVSLTWGNQTIAFRRAPLSPGTNGAELVSWPPLEYTE
jgi:hypothetical protein